jgi:uncharacterized protein YdaU (DUF1376 family)
MGSTTPIPADALAARYADRSAYTKAYEKAADAAIADGFVLQDDRKALIAESHPDRIPT